MPRKRPYTQAGIKRVPCTRCGQLSTYQWQICALQNLWHGVCLDCDIALNKTVLQFFAPPGWQQAAVDYEFKARENTV